MEAHFLTGKHIIIADASIGATAFCIALQPFLNESDKKINPSPRIDVYERETSSDAIGRGGYSLTIRGESQSQGTLDEMLDDGTVLVHFADGRQEQRELLIAADGSNSKVRRALGGNGHLLFVGAFGQNSVSWSISYLSDTPRESKPAGTMSENEIEERAKPYGEPMPTLLKETLHSSDAVFDAKDIVPFRNHGSIIFIGDAQLAEQLIHAESLPEAINAYDDLSIPRTTNAIKKSLCSITIGRSQGIWKHLWVAAIQFMVWYSGYNENISYSQKLHIPASPSDPEFLTINSGKHKTTFSLKYMPQPGIPDS